MSGFQKVAGQPFKVIKKDPAEILDYLEDMTDWLAEVPGGGPADTITGTPSWTVPVGLTNTATSNTPTGAKIWLSGGVLGAEYQVSVVGNTAGGRRFKRTFIVIIEAR